MSILSSPGLRERKRKKKRKEKKKWKKNIYKLKFVKIFLHVFSNLFIYPFNIFDVFNIFFNKSNNIF